MTALLQHQPSASEHHSHQTQRDLTSKSFGLGHATRPVTFIDRPCGTGKTTALIESLQPDRKYLIVVPLLDEADRIIKGAAQRGVTLYAPEANGQTKSQHLLDLTFDDQSIVCTHKLFLEADISFAGYEVHIDEAVDVVWPMSKLSWRDFKAFVLDRGLATVDAQGFVRPEEAWFDEPLTDALGKARDLAANGVLVLTKAHQFLKVLPRRLFEVSKSCTVHTYMAETTMLVAYMRKLGLDYTIHKDEAGDAAFRQSISKRLTIKKLDSKIETLSFSYSAQNKHNKQKQERVALSLRNLRSRELVGVEPSSIMVSCKKSNWEDGKGPYAKGSTLAKEPHWLEAKKKATNAYRHCTHMVYLNDLHLPPSIKLWLGLDDAQQDEWAKGTLVQWVFRSALREPEGPKVTFYSPSKRMRGLLNQYCSEKALQQGK